MRGKGLQASNYSNDYSNYSNYNISKPRISRSRDTNSNHRSILSKPQHNSSRPGSKRRR